MHIHVEKGGGYGKIWLKPEIEVAYFNNFSSREMNQIIEIVRNEIVTFRI